MTSPTRCLLTSWCITHSNNQLLSEFSNRMNVALTAHLCITSQCHVERIIYYTHWCTLTSFLSAHFRPKGKRDLKSREKDLSEKRVGGHWCVIHPSIFLSIHFLYHFFYTESQGAWSLFQETRGTRWGSIAEQNHIQSITSCQAVYNTCLWTRARNRCTVCGGKPQRTRRTCKLHTQSRSRNHGTPNHRDAQQRC